MPRAGSRSNCIRRKGTHAFDVEHLAKSLGDELSSLVIRRLVWETLSINAFRNGLGRQQNFGVTAHGRHVHPIVRLTSSNFRQIFHGIRKKLHGLLNLIRMNVYEGLNA